MVLLLKRYCAREYGQMNNFYHCSRDNLIIFAERFAGPFFSESALKRRKHYLVSSFSLLNQEINWIRLCTEQGKKKHKTKSPSCKLSFQNGGFCYRKLRTEIKSYKQHCYFSCPEPTRMACIVAKIRILSFFKEATCIIQAQYWCLPDVIIAPDSAAIPSVSNFILIQGNNSIIMLGKARLCNLCLWVN